MDIAAKIAQRNRELVEIINRTRIDASYAYDNERLLAEKTGLMARDCARVLDFGKSSRGNYKRFRQDQIVTADINRFEDYPDILIDICDWDTFPDETFDGVIVNAVIEHVYDPAAAVANVHRVLRDGGVCLAYAPFIFHYHAPRSLVFQDYFRFTKDGMAYLFRDFSEVTLYPVRGWASSAVNFLFPGWKRGLERKLPGANRFLDTVLAGKHHEVQVSGYTVWAVK